MQGLCTASSGRLRYRLLPLTRAFRALPPADPAQAQRVQKRARLPQRAPLPAPGRLWAAPEKGPETSRQRGACADADSLAPTARRQARRAVTRVALASSR